ncbi:AMP-binding protein [Alsobacter sp. KACC 23698]|uniref:AMP-binding protein n=1 Tax=Alsobacter sp. KACC 23698 TaxID=3149229 RepID=A0AAU7JEX7_9HYPH
MTLNAGGRTYPPAVDWALPIPPARVESMLDEACDRFGSHVACRSAGETLTYAVLSAQVARVAGGLRAIGAERGERVGLMLPNCPSAVIAFLGVLRAGLVVVNVSPLLAIPEIARQARDSGFRTIIVLDLADHLAVAKALMHECLVQRCIVAGATDFLGGAARLLYRWTPFGGRGTIPADDPRFLRFERIEGQPGPAVTDPTELAVLQYTGGTTGEPKGVMLTHRALHANAVQLARWFTQAEPGADKIVAVLPFFHAFGMTAVMLFAVALGAEMILQPRFDPDAVIRAMERRRATILIGVPLMFRALLQRRRLARADLSALKVCISGGDPLDPALADAFKAATGARVLQGYGLTECGPVVTCGSLDVPIKPASCGLPLPGTRLRIVEPHAPQREPAGEVGEICVSGPQLMAGYWNRPEETAAVLGGGWLRTGDLGRIDRDGYLFVVDRLKDMVTVRGRHVFPRVVEDAIREHPAVADVAVIGAPADGPDSRLAAFVVMRPRASITAKDLSGFLENRLAPYEHPALIRFVDRLPKSALGKILKGRLAHTLS